MIKRVKAKDINPGTMRLVRQGFMSSWPIRDAGRAVDHSGGAEFIRVELQNDLVRIFAPNEMVSVEMIETEPAPTTTTITIEVPVGADDSVRTALVRAARSRLVSNAARDAIMEAVARYRRTAEPNLANIDAVFGPHAFAPGYSGMTCEYAVLHTDGTGDTCGLPPFAIEHTVPVRTANPMRTDAERHGAHAFIGPLVTVTLARVGIYQCADPECDH